MWFVFVIRLMEVLNGYLVELYGTEELDFEGRADFMFDREMEGYFLARTHAAANQSLVVP